MLIANFLCSLPLLDCTAVLPMPLPLHFAMVVKITPLQPVVGYCFVPTHFLVCCCCRCRHRAKVAATAVTATFGACYNTMSLPKVLLLALSLPSPLTMVDCCFLYWFFDLLFCHCSFADECRTGHLLMMLPLLLLMPSPLCCSLGAILPLLLLLATTPIACRQLI